MLYIDHMALHEEHVTFVNSDLVSALMVHLSAPSGGSLAKEGLGEGGC